MKNLAIVFLLLFIGSRAYSQDFGNYQPVVCQKEIPEIFFNYQLSLKPGSGLEAKNGDTYQTIKGKQRFIEMTNFYVLNFLRSGDILFNEPMSDYVNKVADHLLKDFPEIRSNLHFFVTTYPEVNAACLNNGIVIINVGLLAQLENEAQLAFVISHEIIHYINNHGIKSYLESITQKNKARRRNDISSEDRMFAMLQYSKDQEFEADDEGFSKFFLNSGYKLSEAEHLCDVLLYSDFPVDEIEYSKTELEDSLFQIDPKLWIDSVEPINVIEDYDDSQLTHPNIKKRRSRIIEKVEMYGDKGQKFLFGKDEFLNVRNIARFELCNLYIREKKYAEAIYLVYILQKEFPNSKYLFHIKAAAYYGLAIYANKGYISNIIKSSREQKGESQRIFHLLRSMKKKDLNVLAARELWKLHKSSPEDDFILNAFKFTTGQIFANGYFSKGYFNTNPFTTDSIEIKKKDEATDINTEGREDSKYTRIKQKQEKSKTSNKENMVNAFTLFSGDKEFLKYFAEAQNSYQDMNESEDQYSYSGRKDIKFHKKGYPKLNISNLVILSPFYFETANNRNKRDVIYKSNENKPIMVKSLYNAAKNTGIKTTILDLQEFKPEDIEKYQDYQLLNNWIDELSIPEIIKDNLIYEDDYKDTSAYISFDLNRLKVISETYKTRYIASAGVLRVLTKKVPFASMAGLFSIYTAPLTLLSVCLPKYYYYFYFRIYDLNTGKVVYSEKSKMSSKPNALSMESKFYNTLKTIQE